MRFAWFSAAKQASFRADTPPKKNDIGLPYHGKPMTSNPEGSRQENVLPSRQKILHFLFTGRNVQPPPMPPSLLIEIFPDGTNHLLYLLQLRADHLDVVDIKDAHADFALEDAVLGVELDGPEVEMLEGGEDI